MTNKEAIEIASKDSFLGLYEKGKQDAYEELLLEFCSECKDFEEIFVGTLRSRLNELVSKSKGC